MKKKIFDFLPVSLLILMVFYYWFLTALILNPVAIFLLLLLVSTLLFRNIILTVFTSSALSLLSLYMIFAVISEYREFNIGDADGIRLLIGGLALFITTLILSIVMGFRSLVRG